MATIGQFRSVDSGFEGTISTLTMGRKVKFVANDKKKGENSPDYFVKTGNCDLGFARNALAKGDNATPYLKVFLDDPSFPEPVWAALFPKGNQADLVWSRPKRQDAMMVAAE